MDNEEARYPGASAEAIRAHYDAGNDFYRLLLDETMTYSAAMWRDERDTSSLADAQRALPKRRVCAVTASSRVSCSPLILAAARARSGGLKRS